MCTVFACVVKVNYSTRKCRLGHTHLLKNTLTLSPKPLTFPLVHLMKLLQRELFLPLQLLPEAWREENPTCHFRYSARWKLAQKTWLGEAQCQCRVKASVGVIGSVKGSFGTSQFTTGCVVIQTQGNIWEPAHVGAHLSHSPLPSDIWARLLLHGIKWNPRSFLLVMLYCCAHGRWKMKEVWKMIYYIHQVAKLWLLSWKVKCFLMEKPPSCTKSWWYVGSSMRKCQPRTNNCVNETSITTNIVKVSAIKVQKMDCLGTEGIAFVVQCA